MRFLCVNAMAAFAFACCMLLCLHATCPVSPLSADSLRSIACSSAHHTHPCSFRVPAPHPTPPQSASATCEAGRTGRGGRAAGGCGADGVHRWHLVALRLQLDPPHHRPPRRMTPREGHLPAQCCCAAGGCCCGVAVGLLARWLSRACRAAGRLQWLGCCLRLGKWAGVPRLSEFAGRLPRIARACTTSR